MVLTKGKMFGDQVKSFSSLDDLQPEIWTT
jgi:hypothetical protein